MTGTGVCQGEDAAHGRPPSWARLVRRVPRGAWGCALVALINALVWSLLTPPFQVPDEPQHVAYAQYLAETGKLPRPVPGSVFSDEEAAATAGERMNGVIGNPRGRPPWNVIQANALRSDLNAGLSRRSQGGASSATNNPPLYYALEAVPYALGASGDFLHRLALMRALSALMAAGTVLFVFLFLRELLPGTPWAWPVGALAVAFQPTFGFISGGVTNDDGLYLAAAALFWLLARAFRRGLTPGRGIAIGTAVGLGLVTKANIIGFLPGVGLALCLLALRAGPDRRREALRGAVVAIAVAAVPVVAYVILDATVWNRPVWSGVTGANAGVGTGKQPNTRQMLVYLWEFYLPKLWFMQDQFGYYPLWETWFKGFVGRFGWLDYGFPISVYWITLGVYVPMLALTGRALARGRRILAGRWAELLSYLSMVAGLLALIGVAGYRGRLATGQIFEQARYLLPLLPLYGALVALGARGAGRRWGPTVGAVLVVLAMAHGLFSQLLTISRYYG